MIIKPPDYRKSILPHRVFFTWDITYKCNYKCSYCNYGREKDAFTPANTVYPGIERLIEIWMKIYRRYGSCEIHFAGGEPFAYPGFMDFVESISEFHTWECSTNFYWDPEELIERIKPGRARIGVSFHPEFANFDNFLEKAVKLKKAGFEVWANYVAYPPFMGPMRVYKQKFADVGISMSILPFKGKYKGKNYPDEYTDDEREYLKSLGTEVWVKKTLDFTFGKKNSEKKGKLCRMGQMYARILSDGNVYSCCSKTARKLGNLFDGSFSLLEDPIICEDENCPCWKCMVVGEEDRWKDHWVVPADARDIIE